MANLTQYDTSAGELLVLEEERLLSAKGYITHDEMYKIMRHLAEKLSEYERAEEQGLLLSLPCKIGDTIYHIQETGNSEGTKIVEKFVVCRFWITKLQNFVLDYDGNRLNFAQFGKTVFLTKEEAKKALTDITEN